MTSRTPWGKLAGLFSLKAILLACFLTPLPVSPSGLTAAYAQFQIIIPGFGYRQRHRYRSRGYRSRSSRRGRGSESRESAGTTGTPVTSNKGYKGGSD
jgi:hypothetical protein